jgi:acyl-coenzyme A thioesterase PaaI-like protein
MGRTTQIDRADRVIAPHLGDLVRVRRTAEVLQQGRIKHVADLRIATADDPGETACDEAALERLL